MAEELAETDIGDPFHAEGECRIGRIAEARNGGGPKAVQATQRYTPPVDDSCATAGLLARGSLRQSSLPTPLGRQ